MSHLEQAQSFVFGMNKRQTFAGEVHLALPAQQGFAMGIRWACFGWVAASGRVISTSFRVGTGGGRVAGLGLRGAMPGGRGLAGNFRGKMDGWRGLGLALLKSIGRATRIGIDFVFGYVTLPVTACTLFQISSSVSCFVFWVLIFCAIDSASVGPAVLSTPPL